MTSFVSLCMIVKNEEQVLERCLSSVVNLVDEMVIVDTGSTDGTKEIALKYTNNIYDFEWISDFAAARNFATSKASGEWILVLDADEYVDEENFCNFVQEIKDDNDIFDVYTAKILNFTGNLGESLVQNYHYRIYKNNGELSYYRNIHEQIKNNKGEQLKAKNSSLLIFHSGYLNKTVIEKNKSERNKELLDKEMNSGVKNAFDYFNYGNEYSSIGDYEKALDSYLQAYKRKTDFQLSWVSTTLVQIVICLINLKRYNEALDVIKDAEIMYNTSPEFPYLRGEIYCLRGQFEDAKQLFLQIVDNNQQYNHIILRPDLRDQKPHTRLGEIYLYEENYQNSVFHYSSVLNINKYNEEGIKRIIYILNKIHTAEEIAEFLKSNGLVNKKNITNYVKTCFDVGNPSLAIKLLDDYTDEYRLLNKVALLKRLCINNIGDIGLFYDILKPEIIKNLMKSNWINIIDILLLREHLSTEKDLMVIYNSLKQCKQINKLIDLADGHNTVENIDENLITYGLQTFFAYNKYEFCNLILDEIENVNKTTIIKVAKILFSNGFKAEALELYNLCDWDLYNEQDFVNIINSLLDTNNKNGVLEVTKYAMTVFEEDFRFYKYVLENTEDSFVFKQTFQKAAEIFIQSEYLENIISVDSRKFSEEDKGKIIFCEQEKKRQTKNSYTVGFFLETIFHYYVYESIINELVNKGVECHLVINDNFNKKPETQDMYNALIDFIQNLDRNDIKAYTVSMIRENQFIYDTMVSCYYSPWIENVAKKQVRAMYSLAKDYWTYSWWNVFYDKILCYGNYDYEKLNIYNNCAIVGNPKFDNWYRGNINFNQVKEKFTLDENKQNILYAPTYGHLSSIDDWIDEISNLQENYNVIIKLHHGTAYRESEQFRRDKLNQEFNNITSDSDDLFSLFSIADFVITDNSGMIFDSMLAEQAILLLNSDFQPNIDRDGTEQKIRNSLININKGMNIQEILDNKELFKKNKRVISNLVKRYYKMTGGYSGELASDEIIGLLTGKQNDKNTLLLSIRKQIFGY
jgi:glycosyltransferase involved in cell wall biosynthesis